MKEIKVIIVILFCLLLYSCASKSIYYAWGNEEGNYCTLEVKKHEVIYRGSAANLVYPGRIIYLYLYNYDSQKNFNNFEKNVIALDINNFEAKYFVFRPVYPYDKEREFEYQFGDFSTSIEWGNFGRRISYVMRDYNPDTLYLSGGTIKDEYTLNDYCNVQDSTLLSLGMVWFPPQMHRVDKIDYTKFNERAQKMNLKEPWKGTPYEDQKPRTGTWNFKDYILRE